MNDVNYRLREDNEIDSIAEITFESGFDQGIKWNNEEHIISDEHALDDIEEGDEVVLKKDHDEVVEKKLEAQAKQLALRINDRKNKFEEREKRFRKKKQKIKPHTRYFEKKRLGESAKKKELEKVLELIEEISEVDLDEIRES